MDKPKRIYAANNPTAFVIVDGRDYDALLGITRAANRRKDWQHFRRGKRYRATPPTREWKMDRSGFMYCGTPPGPVVWMHREIAGCPANKFMGFRDGSENNLRRMNLVVCDTREQAHSYKHAALARAAAPKPS